MRIVRRLTIGSESGESWVRAQLTAEQGSVLTQAQLASAFDFAWLRQSERPTAQSSGAPIRVIDLFCGAGGMSLGLEELARALNRPFELRWAADVLPAARATIAANHTPVRRPFRFPIEELIDGDPGQQRLTSRERLLRSTLKAESDGIDFLLGGPPCQGHSDLNNHTRWRDPKNQLYWRMARAARVLDPRFVVIENVPGVDRDESGVLQLTVGLLEGLGYGVSEGVLQAEHLGVAQTRHRRFLVAAKEHQPSVAAIAEAWRVNIRPIEWAISGLSPKPGTGIDSPGRPSPDTVRRLQWYDRNPGEVNLPNERRPKCHQKDHNYTSVYGRLYSGKPSSTLTTGFLVMGQGRFVHPNALPARTLSPREGARIQFFPDWFHFRGRRGEPFRKEFGLLIGNAVPPKLSYVVGAHLLSGS